MSPKQFLLLDGKPILHHTLSVMGECSIVDEIILVVSEKKSQRRDKRCRIFTPRSPKLLREERKRQDSVANGLQSLDSETDIVVIHDGVRPFVSPDVIRETVEVARDFGSAITAIPVSDTIKK